MRLVVLALQFALTLLIAPQAWAGQTAGNGWHIPSGEEPGIASMREPLRAIEGAGAVTLYQGNQRLGPGGNPGQQLEEGSALRMRAAGQIEWTELPLLRHSQSGNNEYFAATVAAGTFAPGQRVEYVFRLSYGDHATTFLYGDDAASHATTSQATAEASPFSFLVRHALAAAGESDSTIRGAWEARIYRETGHVAFLGPDAAGAPLALAVTLAPAEVEIDGHWLALGGVVASTPIEGGLEVTQHLGEREVVSRLTLRADGVLRFEVVDWDGPPPSRVTVRTGASGDEHFYGFGEKFNAVDQVGRRVQILTSDHPGDKGDHSYKVTPWFMSTRGYGFHLDSTAESTFDMAARAPERIEIDADTGRLALHLILGPALTTVLGRWTELIGRPPLPPPWVFGPWMSSDHWRNGGEVRYVIERLVQEGIPGSVFVFDSPWETAYNDFTWNTAQFAAGGTYEGVDYPGFASSAEMMAFLRSHGYRAVVWMTPFINTRSNDEGVPGQNLGRAAGYDEAEDSGYLVRSVPDGEPLLVDWWKGTGSPIDFTNPAARDWLSARLRQLVTDSGGVISGFKTDDGEAEFIPIHAAYFDGRTGRDMRNGYSTEYHRAIWDVLGEDGILFSRSGFTGTQAFPAGWAGDNEGNFGEANGLPSVLVAAASAALSGYAIWGHDIGGYLESNPSTEPDDLFVRWTQFGALSPIMQMHRQVQGGMQYPWSYGPEALANYRAQALLHTALFPYLYSHARQAARTGLPIVRPPVLMYPDDPRTYGIAHTYLLGDELLVAPIVQGSSTAREVYLPAGSWLDYFTHERYPGGQTVTWSDTDRSRFPLFVRDGAIVPMLGRADVQTLSDSAYVQDPDIVTPDGSLQILVFPSGTSSFTLYDETTIRCVQEASRSSLEVVQSTARSITFRVLAAEPDWVRRDGAELIRVDDEAALAHDTWTVAGDSVVVRIEHPGGTSRVVLGSGQGERDAGAEEEQDAGGTSGPDAGCACRMNAGPADAAGVRLGVFFLCISMVWGRRAGKTRHLAPRSERPAQSSSIVPS